MSNDLTKNVLRRIPYGVYALTSRVGDEVNAMLVTWLSQVSFEPRLIAVGLQKTSFTWGLVKSGRVFAVNLFDKENIETIKPFTRGRAKKPAKMEEANYTLGNETGCPVLEGAVAYLECKVIAILDVGGDHDIIIGEVIGAAAMSDGQAKDTLLLTDLGWNYAG